MPYEVHLEAYDGPFNLLLGLITAQEVDLYEISLADVVDGFLAELKHLESFDLEVATEFLLIAATLVELKCRRLLPGSADLELDEELSPYEGRDYLLARLVECKTFTAAAARLAELEAEAGRSHARRTGPDERFAALAPDLLASVSPEDLARVMAKALAEVPAPILETSHVHVDEVSLPETLERLVGALPTLRRATLRELTADAGSPAQVVACFLAVLQLYKEQLVDLEQLATFGDLVVTWTGGDPGEEDSTGRLLSVLQASEW